jgi:hypothetical protein
MSLPGLGSSVNIVTGYGLDGPGIESLWGQRFSAPVQTGPGAHPASCTMSTSSFPGVKSGRGVTLTPNPVLVPWSRKGRNIPLLPLWAVRPVRSLGACMRVQFILPSPRWGMCQVPGGARQLLPTVWLCSAGKNLVPKNNVHT